MHTTRRVTLGMTFITALALHGSPSLAAGEKESEELFPGTVRLILPPVIYATPGIECNVYFDNVILTLNTNSYAFDVTCPKGVQLQERWTYTPASGEAGDYPILIEVRDDSNKVAARGRSVIRVSAENQIARPVALLIVGDSLTEYSIYPRHILNLSKQGGKTHLRFIGSRGAGNMPPTDDLRHEGYSGWTAEAFATLSGPVARSGYYKPGATGSPFMYEASDGSKALDFARYCQEFNDGKGPDLITIGLGTNDIFTASDDTIEERIDRVLKYHDQLVESMLKVRADTRLGVQLETPPSNSQDGFRGYVGLGKQTRWQFRRNQHRLMERMIRHYGGRIEERIYIVPNYVNLDTVHGFPAGPSPANARSSEPTTRVINGTHPSDSGYQQIGDVIYSWIVSMAADGN
jgi:lysophospholipase L1-like esterase